MHAAHLVKAIQELELGFTFSGLGGPRMQERGVELYQDLTRLAVVGFVEVLKHYREIKKSFDLILKKIKNTAPAAVILVDYPGFNLRLAREIKRRHRRVKIIYYISPQVWAWKKNRVFQIKKYIDKMLVLFQFEKDFYAKFGMEVRFVGHPLVDGVEIKTEKNDLLSSLGLQEYKLTIGLLPGSRAKEVERHLPLMLEAARLLRDEFPMIQFLILKAPSIDKVLIESTLAPSSLRVPILENQTYDGINACDLCMVTSGTATLETALLRKPMVVLYKTSFLTWVLAKCFVKIRDIGLVNIVAGQRIVPECVQFQATGQNIASELKGIFTDEIKISAIKSELTKVKESLGAAGASHRAAEEIVQML